MATAAARSVFERVDHFVEMLLYYLAALESEDSGNRAYSELARRLRRIDNVHIQDLHLIAEHPLGIGLAK